VDAQNQPFATRVLPYGGAAIAEAARLIAEGLPVAIPTETVYGLAADATNGEAVARIYEAKGRPSFNPLIVHVASIEAAEGIAAFDAAARTLARRFWPGPLTLVLPLIAGNGIASLVTAGLPTIALRVSAHPAMRDLLEATGRPLAAPSANASGRLSPTRAAHVLAGLGGRIGLIVDAGPTEHGLESTIVAVDHDGRLRLLRPGPIGSSELEVAATSSPPWKGGVGGGSRPRGFDAPEGAWVKEHGAAPRLTHPQPLPSREGSIEAPGQLASHYAPSKPLRLGATERRRGEWLIGYGEIAGDSSLSPAGDPVEAAARLFDLLHEAEASPAAAIAVAPVPCQGLGAAINDRLARAAAPGKEC